MKAFLIITFISFSALVFATGHHTKHPMQDQLAQTQIPLDPQFQSFHAMHPQPSGINSLPDRIADMFMDQGLIGAFLLCLGFYLFKVEKAAAIDRKESSTKLETLIVKGQDNLLEVKTELASINARIENLERETETLKDFILTNSKLARI